MRILTSQDCFHSVCSARVEHKSTVANCSLQVEICIAFSGSMDRVLASSSLKEHVALDRSSWSLKSVCYKMHMVRKML